MNKIQVEVSKYMKGTKENAICSNGMPEFLIRYNGNSSRQSSHFLKKHLFDTLFSVEYFKICCE